MLEPLLTGQPMSIAALERQVLLADDLPGVVLRKTSFERDGNKGVLLVEAYRQDWSGRASLATDGTRPVGPVRARIDVDTNHVMSRVCETASGYRSDVAQSKERNTIGRTGIKFRVHLAQSS